MPNHCENDLWMSGKKQDVAAVLTLVGADKEKPEFDFNNIIPYPDPFKSMDDDREAIPNLVGVYRDDPEYSARLAARNAAIAAYEAKWHTTSDGYNSGGYEWCRANWGTKWNAYAVARRDYDDRVCVTFQTAWAPPTPVIIALALRFPTVTFTLEYFERGMSCAGGFEIPSEDDWYEDTPWKPGALTDEWAINTYHGIRGG